MKAKTLVPLMAVAVILVVAAVRSTRTPAVSAEHWVGRTVLENLPVNDIDRIVIQRQDQALKLVRKDNQWVVVNKFNYPATFGRIRDMLIRLSEMKIGQKLAVDDRQRQALQLMAAPSGGVSVAGTVVELNAGGKAVATLAIGADYVRKAGAEQPGYGAYPDGKYISPDNGRSVYLVAENLDYAPAARDWLDPELANVAAPDIQSITITGEGREAVHLRRDGETLRLEGVKGNEEPATEKIGELENSLAFLTLEDVADPTLNDAALGMARPVKFEATTKNGEIYTITVGGKAGTDRRYVRIATACAPRPETPTPAAADTNLTAQAAAAKAAERKAQETARLDLEVRMAAKQKLHCGWTYVISAYKADTFTLPRESLVKDKPAPVPPPAPAPAPAAAAAPVKPPAAAVDAGTPPSPPGLQAAIDNTAGKRIKDETPAKKGRGWKFWRKN